MKQHAESLLSPAARWAWTLTLLAVAAASGVLAYLLSIGATTPSGFIERHQGWLYWVNLGVGAVLGLVVLARRCACCWRVRRGRFGAQLLGKMALVFALVAALPGRSSTPCRFPSSSAASRAGSTCAWPARSRPA
jgi:hypothetical protein